jgi:hypothetical protein
MPLQISVAFRSCSRLSQALAAATPALNRSAFRRTPATIEFQTGSGNPGGSFADDLSIAAGTDSTKLTNSSNGTPLSSARHRQCRVAMRSIS